jgi:hypothetical protein
MTVAETHGKISEAGTNLSERMEDLLTSDIFGCMRYLPHQKALIPFLRTAKSFRGSTLQIPDTITKVHYSFWPWLKFPNCVPCEPDVLLGLEAKEALHLIMIEAKYFSGLSSEEDDQDKPNSQLARELDNLSVVTSSQFACPSKLNIGSRSLVFITQDMKLPANLLAQSLTEYQLKRGREADIFWTSWRFLPDIIETLLTTEATPEHRAILEDMLLLLKRKRLIMFGGMEPVASEIKASDLDFYHITMRRFKWPDFTILRPIEYSYSHSENKYKWPSIPAIKTDYEYEAV